MHDLHLPTYCCAHGRLYGHAPVCLRIASGHGLIIIELYIPLDTCIYIDCSQAYPSLPTSLSALLSAQPPQQRHLTPNNLCRSCVRALQLYLCVCVCVCVCLYGSVCVRAERNKGTEFTCASCILKSLNTSSGSTPSAENRPSRSSKSASEPPASQA